MRHCLQYIICQCTFSVLSTISFDLCLYVHWLRVIRLRVIRLRVINEDRVSPSQGFGTHGHRNFEIFSYIVAGELTHSDSMKNVQTLGRGWVQV